MPQQFLPLACRRLLAALIRSTPAAQRVRPPQIQIREGRHIPAHRAWQGPLMVKKEAGLMQP
jgi:hypothetical protein